MADDDIPSPIDLRDPGQAKAWEVDTIRRRPDRPQFFGFVAETILEACDVSRYVALDFSVAMHDLARERLGELASKVELQAAHETRHKRHLPTFLTRAGQCLASNGLFLYCDHYFELGGAKDADLMPTPEEQLQALHTAGCMGKLLDTGGMALTRARVKLTQCRSE